MINASVAPKSNAAVKTIVHPTNFSCLGTLKKRSPIWKLLLNMDCRKGDHENVCL